MKRREALPQGVKESASTPGPEHYHPDSLLSLEMVVERVKEEDAVKIENGDRKPSLD